MFTSALKKELDESYEKGEIIGIEKGRIEGIEKGRIEGIKESIIRLHKKLGFQSKQIADILEIEEDFVKRILSE